MTSARMKQRARGQAQRHPVQKGTTTALIRFEAPPSSRRRHTRAAASHQRSRKPNDALVLS